ncbi:MAG TPA: LLM class flavin-dependent oxidoreductase [Dehalococcoidia bacterium]|nr:LLM class flavin-dependent oxidoreductase [Dehalococcoidia bacterium]
MAQRGVGIFGETPAEYLELAQQAESAGFHSIWSNELHRTAFVPLAAVAARTSRIQLGTGVVLAFTRSPLITALSALDLDELAGGRLILGLGTGVQRLNEDWHGVRYGKPVPHLRETVAVLRLFLDGLAKGRPIDFEGEYYNLHIRGYERHYPPVRERIPIVLGGVGPLMVRLAGEVGDGWLGHSLSSPEYLSRVIVPQLKAGLDRAGRSRQDFQIMPSVTVSIGRDAREARRVAAGSIAFYATVRTYQSFFAFHGFESALPPIQAAFKRGDIGAMIEAVPDEMIDAYTAAGTIDQVRARLAKYDETADVIRLVAAHQFVSPEETREQQRNILDMLGQ